MYNLGLVALVGLALFGPFPLLGIAARTFLIVYLSIQVIQAIKSRRSK